MESLRMASRFDQVHAALRQSKTIVDLGCGNNPVPGATAAVDLNLEPSERALGHGSSIDVERFKQRGIRFVNSRIDAPLPFADKEFDFAYSHHVFEHVEDPAIACAEMVRIARAGAIITPSPFAELAFGRPYHRWLVLDRAGALFFFSKRREEDRPFGEHPEWVGRPRSERIPSTCSSTTEIGITSKKAEYTSACNSDCVPVGTAILRWSKPSFFGRSNSVVWLSAKRTPSPPLSYDEPNRFHSSADFQSGQVSPRCDPECSGADVFSLRVNRCE
jgi:SAM-dependent methyltransferase